VVIEVFCVRTRGVQEREVKEYVVDIPELGTTDFLLFERARTHEAYFELFETEVVQVVLRHMMGELRLDGSCASIVHVHWICRHLHVLG
jgi:hypothetical protein